MNSKNVFVKKSFKSLFTVIMTFLFVYVVLFQFILPVNKVLPKPSVVLESFVSLFQFYNFLNDALITLSVIFLSILSGYFAIRFSAGIIIKSGIYNAPAVFKYFPPFFYAVLFLFWFGNSLWGEYFFGFLIALFYLGKILHEESLKTNPEYLLSAKSLGASEKIILKEVILKSAMPGIFNSFTALHIYLWGIILVFEFINASTGLGNVYRRIVEYNDFAALFSAALIASLLMWAGNLIIKFVRKKFVFWE